MYDMETFFIVSNKLACSLKYTKFGRLEIYVRSEKARTFAPFTHFKELKKAMTYVWK